MSKLTVEIITKELNEQMLKYEHSGSPSLNETKIEYLLTVISNLKQIKEIKTVSKQTSKRGFNFMMFAFTVLDHIEDYTVPQYGDEGEDEITHWTVEECLKAVSKRIARYGRNSRDGQQELDFKKMVHEIQLAAEKYDELEKVVENHEKLCVKCNLTMFSTNAKYCETCGTKLVKTTEEVYPESENNINVVLHS